MKAYARVALGSSCSVALAALLWLSCSSDEEESPGGAAASSAQGGGGESAAGGEPGAGTGGSTPDAGRDAAETGAGGASTGAGGTALSPAPPLPSVARIMALGDSITRATCWRARLWERLNQAAAGRFDFAGTLASDSGCTPAEYDRDNQGYSSSLVTEIVAGVTGARTCDPSPCPALADLRAAFAAAAPDVVLMHFGTNDVWNSRPTNTIIEAYSAVLGALREATPNVRLFVAQIIPMNVTEATCAGCTCASCGANIDALNAQIEAWAAAQGTEASPITVVDQWTGFDTATDTGDGVHPNAAGSQKMADAWFNALEPLFGTE